MGTMAMPWLAWVFFRLVDWNRDTAPMDPTYFETAADFRAWLRSNHDSARELLLGFYKKNSGRRGITYAEALDEALCFGWIDGIRKSIDDVSYMIRFTPRKPKSNWSQVNLKRAGELVELGRMQPAGLKAFQGRDLEKSRQYSFEQTNPVLGASDETMFRANAKAWDFFQSQAPSYQRAAIWWVTSAKKDETRLRRLATLIADSADERRLAQFARG